MSGRRLKEYTVEVDGRDVPVRLRRNRRARRLILRADGTRPDGEPGVVVTLPNGVPEAEALAWVETQTGWISRQFRKLPERIAFEDGVVIPLGGIDHEVRHRPDARRGVWTEGSVIHVSGQPEHLPRRLTDWLKKEARTRITERVQVKAASADADFGRISIRDTGSRWGSCASNGNLNFSWRLVLTPEFVFDYVVAHEVAHLHEHNHGPRFWQLVDTLTEERERARAWLNSFGAQLHSYG